MKTKTKKRLMGFLFAAAIALLPALQPGAYAAKVDSLEQVLRTKKLSGNERLQLYNDLYFGYFHNDFSKAIPYAREGLALARKGEDRRWQMRFFYIMALACTKEDKPDSAMYYNEQALHLAQELGDKRLIAQIYLEKGLIYLYKGMFTQAQQCFMEALAYFEKNGDKTGLANIYVALGTTYAETLNYEKSLYYLSKAEALHRETGNMLELALTITQIADQQLDARGPAIYRDKAAMDSLIALVKGSVEILKDANHLSGVQGGYHILSGFYTAMDDYANAQAYRDSASQLSPDTAYNKGPGFYTYYSQGKYAESEEAALAWIAASDSSSTPYFSSIYNAMEHVILSNIKMGNAERAEEYLDELWVKIRKYMAEGYEKGFSEMEVKYETDKKELRIATLERERALYFWLGLAAAVILLLVLLAMILWAKWAKKERQLVATQSVLDGEMAERTRLARDLHDGLGGMLSVVKLNLEEMKNSVSPDDAERYDDMLNLLNDSSSELRRVTHNLMPGSLVRSDLKTSLMDFCDSIPGVDFQYLGAAADRFDPKQEVMIYRTVHELVNNALRHANAEHILVQIIEEGSRLSLIVQDDGQGFDPKASTPGMGLKNIRHRVAANNGHLEISSEAGKGTEISVEFKIRLRNASTEGPGGLAALFKQPHTRASTF